jgi:hypothetical protein
VALAGKMVDNFGASLRKERARRQMPRRPSHARSCESACNRDPVFGVIGIQSRPRDNGSTLASMILGSRGWDADCGDDCEGSAGVRGCSYQGGYDAVRRYAKRWSKAHGQSTTAAYVPLRFAPGEAYQFDWSHEVVLLSGVTVIVKVAYVRLCHSRMFVRARLSARDAGDGFRCP